MRRVISLWFPALAIDRLRRERPGVWRDEPLALTQESAGRVIVSACNEAALAAGVSPGMALADARAVVPRLATLPADPAADAALLARIAAWCGRYTPWTAPEGEDGVWLDATGCAHLFGGERAMLRDLLSHLAGFGMTARAALAETPGAAWALSHFAEGDRVVKPGAIEKALAPLPVAALRLGPAAVAGLTRLGLKRIGDLYALPRAPVTLRFGDEVMRRLGQALGRIAEPVSPSRPPPRFRARIAFAEPIGLADDIAAALRRLLHRLCEQLATYVVFASFVFSGMSCVAVLRLRRPRPAPPRPYRAWGYPVTPLVFIGFAAWLVGNTVVEAPRDAAIGAGPGYRRSVKEHAAGRWLLQSGDNIENRRFTAPGVSDQGDELASCDVQVDILKDLEISLLGWIYFAEVF